MRLFIAVDPSAAAITALAAAQDALRATIACKRWTDLAGTHLTLHFLGETTEADAAVIDDALAACAREARPFTLALAPLGAFPSAARARVLWAGVGGDVIGLGALHAALGEALRALGRAPEARAFKPHLTLAREPADLAAARLAIRAVTLPSVAWCVDEAILYRSHLGAMGSRYEAIARHCLGPTGASRQVARPERGVTEGRG